MREQWQRLAKIAFVAICKLQQANNREEVEEV